MKIMMKAYNKVFKYLTFSLVQISILRPIISTYFNPTITSWSIIVVERTMKTDMGAQ